MVAEQDGVGRRLLFVLIGALIVAGLAAIVIGFGTGRFIVSGLGLATVIAATVTLVVVRPQQTNWVRRAGGSAFGVGGGMLITSLLWSEPSVGLAVSFAGLGLGLLGFDILRHRSRSTKVGLGGA